MTSDYKNLIAELSDEIRRERSDAMSSGEKRLNEIARKLLQLERDLAVPGAGISAIARQARILDMLEDEDF
jgi:ABC-type lipopolysaccharide export system ATPase subunit